VSKFFSAAWIQSPVQAIMKTIANINILLALVVLSFACPVYAGKMLFADHPLVGKIWDMKSSSFIDEATLLARMDKATVLLLGETHDNPRHHEIQQTLLKARIASGARPALLMEQLDDDSQPALDRALAGSNSDAVLNKVTKLIKFADWKFYRPFLAIAVHNRLPIIAANISSLRLQPAIWKGFAAYDPGDLERLAVERVWSDSRQNYLLRNMGGAHCGKLRDELRAGLTRSQRLRDALMVDSAMSSLGRGVVGIVGSGHARRDIGMPIYFAARAPQAQIYSVGFVEVSPQKTDPKAYAAQSATGDTPYDVIWFTPRVARKDPCAELNKQLKAAQQSSGEPNAKP
jgi:uncharacterized iron-regulated protein